MGEARFYRSAKSKDPLRNIVALVLAIAIPFLLFGNRGCKKVKIANKILEYKLVHIEQIKREYAGKLRIYSAGAEQDIYIDKKPFGSLDEVKTKLYSRGGYEGEMTRKPTPKDEGRFEVIEYFARKEHPAHFVDLNKE